MSTIDYIVPTFGRPHMVDRVAENIAAISQLGVQKGRTIFVCEKHDPDTIAAVKQCRFSPDLVINTRTANYAGALNSGYEHSDADWVFTGADDLIWGDQWQWPLVDVMNEGWFTVLGTNDLLNAHVEAGFHSTHSLVARSYLEEFGGVADEGPGSFYPECYDHNFCDTEFINTAKMRGRFRPGLNVIVRHMHVTTGMVEADDTYLRSIRNYDADARMYDMRISVWSGISR